jgi:hypothetical protein
MNLDECLAQAALSLEAFAASRRAATAEGEEGFVGPRFENLQEVDWWREVAAYHEMLEMEMSVVLVESRDR